MRKLIITTFICFFAICAKSQNNLELAQSNFNAKKYQQAITYYEKAIAVGWNDNSRYAYIGVCYFNLNQYQQAITYYEKAITEGWNDNYRYANIGKCYSNLNQYQQAITYYEKAIAEGWNDNSRYSYIGVCYSNLNQYQQAITYYEKAITEGWNDNYRYANIGKCYSNLNQYQQAITYYEKAIAEGWNDNYRYSHIGFFYNFLNQYQQAITYYEKAITEGWNDNYRYANIASCYRELNQHQQALTYFEKAISEGWNHNLRYFYIGECYRNLEKYQQAIDYYEKAIAENKDNSAIPNNMGTSYEELGKYKEAMRYYCKASEMGSAISTCHIALLYTYGRGVTVDYTKAQEYLAKAKEQIIDNIGAYRYLDYKGEVYLKSLKYDEARKVWEELQSKHPNEIEILAKRKNEVFVLAMRQGLNTIDTNIPETNAKNENTFAFVIANENYKRIATVPFAINDGKIFAEYCRKTLGIPETNIHLLCDASLGDMKYNTKLIKQIADAYDGDAKFIIYYAGHGIPAENQEQAFLLPIDGYGADDTGYSLNELYTELGNMNAKSVIVLLDACFSGTQRNGDMLASARGVAIKAKSAVPQGNMVVLSAAQGDETAYPDNENEHGLFTYFLLKKLQDSKGECTMGELSDYVISNVKKRSIVVNGKLQTPSANSSKDFSNWRNCRIK